MHVGFFLDTSALKAWNWTHVLQDDVPLSGTDGAVLRTVHQLASSSPIDVSLLTPLPGAAASATPVSQIAVADLLEAVQYAHAHTLDVLVFNNPVSADVTAGVCQAERLQQPCIVWCHNGPSRNRADYYATSPAIHRVVCVSHPHADTYRDKPVFEKVAVIHNGIDTERYAPDEDSSSPHSACYVGAITPDKGFHHLARAWPTVRAAVPDARLTVVGSARLYARRAPLGPLGVGPPSYEAASLIPHLGRTRQEAEDRFGVTFCGLLSPRQVRHVMQTAAIGVVNTNLRHSLETSCVTAIEMQATGTAVVGGRRKGLRETVQDGTTGLLINAQRNLAPALVHLLTNPEKAHRMGMRGRLWVKQTFDLQLVVKQWHCLLHAVARNKPLDSPSFSFEHTTPTTILREGIRYLHRLAGPGKRIALLDRLLNATRR